MTLGDPNKQTGGYLYHRRLAEAAPSHDADMTFVSFPERPFPLPALSGRRVTRAASEADVIVIDSIVTAFAAPWLAKVNKSLVGMLHQKPGGIDHGSLRTRVQASLDRRAYRHLDLLLVASESLKEDLSGLHRDIRVVAPGRDVAATVEEGSEDLRAGRDVAFLCVGNWVARKGIVELLDAIALLPPSAATLHLIGDENAEPRYARNVRQRVQWLGDRVVVHGVVSKERVAAFYRDADAFVMPSFEEPYGTAYGEAMAFGLPVVGWRAGNLPHLAEDEREGLIVAPGDVARLAAALRRLSEDEGLRTKLGEAARARADGFPTWEDTAMIFFSALRDIASSPKYLAAPRPPDLI